MTRADRMLKLYDYELSADAYGVRLFLSLRDIAYEKIAVDVFPGIEHRSDAFLEKNPFGRVPALVDGDLVLGGTEAILCHLAVMRDPERVWLPEAPEAFSTVLSWLFFAARDLAAAEAARLEAMLGISPPMDHPRTRARTAFRILEDRLTRQTFAGQSFLAGERATIADLACFPGVALSNDFDIGLEEFPMLRTWTRRIRKLPGFVGMPGIPDYM